MKESFFISACAMDVAQTRISVLSNNLANINTVGFKKDKDFVTAYKDALALNTGAYGKQNIPEVASIITDFSQGNLRFTDNKFNVGLDGEGFFKVQLPDGQIGYTRRGVLKTNTSNQLVTDQGFPVLGKGGPITLTSNDLNIDATGIVFDGTGNYLGELQMVDFPKPLPLEKVGNGIFVKTDENAQEIVAEPYVKQLYVEDSNLDSVSAMVEMLALMESMRSYETNQKLVQFTDKTLDKVINELGRV